jgi:hypothetical protein
MRMLRASFVPSNRRPCSRWHERLFQLRRRRVSCGEFSVFVGIPTSDAGRLAIAPACTQSRQTRYDRGSFEQTSLISVS